MIMSENLFIHISNLVSNLFFFKFRSMCRTPYVVHSSSSIVRAEGSWLLAMTCFVMLISMPLFQRMKLPRTIAVKGQKGGDFHSDNDNKKKIRTKLQYLQLSDVCYVENKNVSIKSHCKIDDHFRETATEHISLSYLGMSSASYSFFVYRQIKVMRITNIIVRYTYPYSDKLYNSETYSIYLYNSNTKVFPLEFAGDLGRTLATILRLRKLASLSSTELRLCHVVHTRRTSDIDSKKGSSRVRLTEWLDMTIAVSISCKTSHLKLLGFDRGVMLFVSFTMMCIALTTTYLFNVIYCMMLKELLTVNISSTFIYVSLNYSIYSYMNTTLRYISNCTYSHICFSHFIRIYFIMTMQSQLEKRISLTKKYIHPHYYHLIFSSCLKVHLI